MNVFLGWYFHLGTPDITVQVTHIYCLHFYRRLMLEKSNDDLPYSIALMEKIEDGPSIVIGHSRLCKVYGVDNACFVESGMNSIIYFSC